MVSVAPCATGADRRVAQRRRKSLHTDLPRGDDGLGRQKLSRHDDQRGARDGEARQRNTATA